MPKVSARLWIANTPTHRNSRLRTTGDDWLGNIGLGLFLEAAPQGLGDGCGHKWRHIRTHACNVPHQGGREPQVLFPARKVDGLDLGGQSTVHESDGLFGLEIAHLAQSPQKDRGAQLASKIYGESVPGVDFYVVDSRSIQGCSEEFDSLFCRE